MLSLCESSNIKASRWPKTSWEGVNSVFTLFFEALIMQLCTRVTVQTTADMINVDDEKIWRILHMYVELAREDVDLSRSTCIGLDEPRHLVGCQPTKPRPVGGDFYSSSFPIS